MNSILDLFGRPFAWIPDAILAAKSQAVSKNLQELAIKDHQSLMNRIVNSASANVNQTNIIKFSNIAGDLNISGNKILQTAQVNLSELFRVASDQTTQQDIATAVQQSAKSLTTGINFLQSSAAINESKQYVDVASNISSEIANSCLASIVQYNNFEVDKVGGSFKFNDNSISQMSSNLASCNNTVVSRESSLSKLAAQIAQTSSATLEGISLAQLIGLYVVIAIAAASAALFLLNKTSGRTLNFVQNNLPLIISIIITIVGVSTATSGYIQSTPTITTDAFSTGYNCSDGILKTVKNQASIEEIGKTCLDDGACAGFDAKGTETGYDVSYYSKLCPTKIKIDSSPTLSVPVFMSGSSEPTLSSSGTFWLNTSNSDYFIKTNGIWSKSGTFSLQAFGIAQLPASFEATADTTTTMYINKATYECKYKDKSKIVAAPKFISTIAPFINTSGYKVTNWRRVQITIGTTLIIIGICAVLYVVLFKKTKLAPIQ